MQQPWQRTPWWMTVLIVVLAIVPLCTYPWVIGALPPDAPERTILWIFPVYAVATAVCAWLCYADRPYLSWILLALLVMSEVGVWWMRCASPLSP